ncbi:hypothetical protein QTJ16_007161 [Diplocarpon rosae]|uniref:Transcription factor domain-containing protein n=1 Tax=Diplocarpon rosae TaxID=946125 RepID=A0AAD9WAS2_9HELO|nr:hypothetical protein QTJ16_007161 [Diplocarpon rosae]
MVGDPATRRLLPQSSQMQSFTFAPNNIGQRETQKNYVFVDEHNRHKRLKVTSDAGFYIAFPAVNADRDFLPGPQDYEGERVEYEDGGSGDDDYRHQVAMLQQMGGPLKIIPPSYTQQLSYSDPAGIYHPVPYGDPPSSHGQPSMHYSNVHTPVSAIASHHSYPQQPVYPPMPLQQPPAQPSQGHQWLALASKHADAFMDVPRLSTLQGMLIVLKARESAPKRGYYYRSWMTVVQCVQMAKDLGLDEHFEEHKAGRPCGSELVDCITKTRIWQTVFACELMIGSPQGRTDLSVDMQSLDLSVPRGVVGNDEAEYHITRNFAYFAKIVLNVRRMNNVYARIKKKKEWGIDPEFVKLNPSFESWMNDLPPDLQVNFPPMTRRHGYLTTAHVYGPYEYRWRLEASYDGLLFVCKAIVQRGINFTIYCILTCTVLHLVALTSPDPDLHVDAREYFTRHMRILEKCTSSWPMPDMQQQIDALREAFSADIRKPFVLKPSFPYGSPMAINTSPPRSVAQYRPHGSAQQVLEQQHAPQHVSYIAHPISPPISAGGVDTKSDSPAVQSLVMMAAGQRGSQIQPPISTAAPMGADPSAWNPSRIFDQWNTTFGAQEIPTLPEMQILPNANLGPNSQPLPPQQYSGAPIPSFVSPSMWQESVASVYEGGLKRQHPWDYDENSLTKKGSMKYSSEERKAY